MKKRGILLHISSLPNEYGIGSFGKCAYDFVDFLVEAGQHYWQVLPLGHTGFGDSPYQTFSAYAGNPYFIDIDILIENGYLTKAAKLKNLNYGTLFKNRYKLLKQLDLSRLDGGFDDFCLEQAFWLEDYGLFMALKNHFGGISFDSWEQDIRLKKADAAARYSELLKREVKWWKAIQYLFYSQWEKLKSYANSKYIKIIGDMPIYVAYDSADVWANPEMFQLDDNRKMTSFAGVPPDSFSEIGQLWGNPLYDWKYAENSDFKWWVQRILNAKKLFDLVRIDHFRGFAGYFSIPMGAATAATGHWEKGEGQKLFEKLKGCNCDIIAEDLGVITEDVVQLLDKTGYPGMKVLQFMLGYENPYNPVNYQTDNCIVYTGTHDNNTTVGWYNSLLPFQKQQVDEICKNFHEEKISYKMMELAYSSRAKIAIIPMQDVLSLGKRARMNIPSTAAGNWKWRLKNIPNGVVADKLRRLSEAQG